MEKNLLLKRNGRRKIKISLMKKLKMKPAITIQLFPSRNAIKGEEELGTCLIHLIEQSPYDKYQWLPIFQYFPTLKRLKRKKNQSLI